jgi:thiamine pyrophosphate-dependent acetolactate synthase large subunit-like protein
MVAPGALWTAAKYQVPILIVMQNNRAYHQEVMWFQRAALMRNRSLELTQEGFGLDNPNIDFAKMAQSLGLGSSGAISDPTDLAAAIRRGIGVVKRGAVLDRRRDAAALGTAREAAAAADLALLPWFDALQDRHHNGVILERRHADYSNPEECSGRGV